MPEHAPEPIVERDAVARLARAIRDAGRFAIDLEFVSEGRYVPDLALVQVGWGDPDDLEVASIDPLAVDPGVVLELVADAEIGTLLHSAQADLALLGQRFGIRGEAIVDTQIAAAFLGFGDQIGYGDLIERTLGVRLEKSSQFSDWLRRPLRSDQLEYALDDVRYLPRAWEALRVDLDDRGRLAWVREESMALAEAWSRRAPPEEAYRRISGWRSLRPAQFAALQSLAAWRERESLEVNRPPARLMQDRTVLELARRSPSRVAALGEVRGINDGVVRRHGEAILQALHERGSVPPPREPARPPLDARERVWVSALAVIVQAQARAASIAARLVGPRDELESLVRWWSGSDREAEPGIPLLQGWRRELAGELALEWLAGRLAIVGDVEAGITLRTVDEDRG